MFIGTFTNVFRLIGDDSVLILRNIFFYVVLFGLFDRGYMTIDTKEADPLTWLKNLWYIAKHPIGYIKSFLNFEETVASSIISFIKFILYFAFVWLWMNVLDGYGVFKYILGPSYGLNFGDIMLVVIMMNLYVAKAF